MDYSFKQRNPSAQDYDGKLEIVQDLTMPFKSKQMINVDYSDIKQECVLSPTEAGIEIVSGQSQTLKFCVATDITSVVDPNSVYIDFDLQIDAGSDATKLTPVNVPTYSQISNLPTYAQVGPKNQVLAMSGTTVKYIYTPNSGCLFNKISFKDLTTATLLAETDNPGLLTKIMFNASGNSFTEHDGIEECENYLAGVNRFMPDDLLCVPASWPDLTSGAAASLGTYYTPSGGNAPLNNWASATTTTVISRSNGSINQVIPEYNIDELNNPIHRTNYGVGATSATIGGTAADVITAATASASMVLSAGAMTTLCKSLIGTIAASSTDAIPFKQVQKQLYHIARGQKVRLYLGSIDYFNSAIKHPSGFSKIQIELVLNTYGQAFTDVSSTAGATGTAWTTTSNFSRFKITEPKLHLTKYRLKAESVNQLTKAVAEKGIEIPFSQFIRVSSNFLNTSTETSINFADRRVRSLSKVIIIPRYSSDVQDSAVKHKFLSSVGCSPDCDGVNRAYNGISSVQLSYMSQNYPQDPVKIAPYKMVQVKKFAMGVFDGSAEAALYPKSYEGLSTISPIERSFRFAQSTADAAVATTASFLITSQYENYGKSFHQGNMSDFFIGFDLRSFKGSKNSGFDISKSDLNITLKRDIVDAYTPNLVLDCYFVCESALRISADGVVTVM